MTKQIVLLSGGIDSTVLLYKQVFRAPHDVEGLVIQMPTKHLTPISELYIGQICHKLKVSYSKIMIKIPIELVYKGELQQILGRNFVLLSTAAMFGASRYPEQEVDILIGLTASDAEYFDATSNILNKFDYIIGNCTLDRVRIEAPFIHMTKTDVVQLGHELKVPFELTWSCYQNGEHHCCKCHACLERIKAFEEAGLPEVMP